MHKTSGKIKKKVRQAYKGKIWQVGVAKFMVGQQI